MQHSFHCSHRHPLQGFRNALGFRGVEERYPTGGKCRKLNLSPSGSPFARGSDLGGATGFQVANNLFFFCSSLSSRYLKSNINRSCAPCEHRERSNEDGPSIRMDFVEKAPPLPVTGGNNFGLSTMPTACAQLIPPFPPGFPQSMQSLLFPRGGHGAGSEGGNHQAGAVTPPRRCWSDRMVWRRPESVFILAPTDRCACSTVAWFRPNPFPMEGRE